MNGKQMPKRNAHINEDDGKKNSKGWIWKGNFDQLVGS